MAVTYQFGVGATFGTGYGLVQNFTVTNTGVVNEAKDENGNCKAQTDNQEVLEATADFVYDTTKSAPAIGATVTVTRDLVAIKYRVMSVTKTESNSDYTKISVVLKRWIHNSLPA
jgi:aspartyl-tRNA synthetase